MFFQLSLPDSDPSPEAAHTVESLALGAPATLTVETLTREQRVAMAQRAHGRVGTRQPQQAALCCSVPPATDGAVTFTA